MADFKTHLGWGLGSGIILAVAGLHAQQLKPVEAMLVVGLAGIGGSIPDLDVQTSRPSKLLAHCLSLAIPLVTLLHFKPKIGDELWINVFFFVLFSVVFYTVISLLIKKMTKHRGIMHSIPFAILCGELTYLIFASDYKLFAIASEKLPFFAGMAITIGYASHLLLDEYYSIYLEGLRPKVKRSFGTAFKLYSKKQSIPLTLMVYLLVIVAAFAIKSQDISYQKLLGLIKGTHKIHLIETQ